MAPKPGPPTNEVSRDPAINQMVALARTEAIATAWDRYQSQQPQCKFGMEGICCRLCHMGPCRITNKATCGICGADRDTIAVIITMGILAPGARSSSPRC